MADQPDMRKIIATLKEAGLRCNCDLDNWEPERDTGHSCVCRIDQRARAIARGDVVPSNG
jgi:hypothetical protein